MATETMKRTILRARDLSCPSCVAKIEKSLDGVEGVAKADVHFATGRIVIDHDAQRVTAQDLVRAVASVGYVAKPSVF